MRILSIINQKGGVGKTTTAVNVAAGLSRAGKRVLLVDVDPQGNIADSLTSSRDQSVIDFLEGRCPYTKCVTTLGTNLDLIHATEELAEFDLLHAQEKDNTLIVTEKFKTVTGYDYILFDCAPNLGLLNQNVMRFAKECLIPVHATYLSAAGLGYMLEAINKINDKFGHNLLVRYIVPTHYDMRIKSQRKLLRDFERDYPGLLLTPIRVNAKLAEAPAAGKSIFAYAKHSRGAKDYQDLVDTILADEDGQETTSTGEPISSRIQRLMADVKAED